MQLDVDEGFDWFDINYMVRFGDVEIPLLFREHVLQHIREYVLPMAGWLSLPSVWFSRFGTCPVR